MKAVLSGILWPALVWFLCTFWLLGGQGKFLWQYYGHWFERDPVSGTLHPGYPWHLTMLLQDGQTVHRCLGMLYCDLFYAGLFDYDRIGVLIGALLHALVAWSLFRLLRLLGLSVAASAAAALLFLSAPVACQTVVTPGLGFVMVSTYLFFLLTAVYIGPARPLQLPALLLLAGASICFYEASGPVYPALPLLYAAANRQRSNRRMWTPIAWLLGVLLLYAIMTVATRSPAKRGGLQSFVPLGSLGSQVEMVAHQAVGFLWLHGLLGDALRQGWQDLSQGHMAAWCLILAAGALLWLSWWWQACQRETDAPDRGRLWLVLAFGVLATVLPWSIVVLIRIPSWVSRFCYFPMVGAVIALAACMDLAGSWLADGRFARRLYWAVAGVVIVASSLCGAIALIGIQSWYQQESRKNDEFVAHVQELVPHPPPAAFFVPIGGCPWPADETARERLAYLDSICPPLWGDTMAATVALRRSYQRRDISCWQVRGKLLTEMERWPQHKWDNLAVFEEADTRSFRIPVIHTKYLEHETRTWKNVIPFTMDCSLGLHLIGTIHLKHPNGSEEEVRLPWVAAMASRPDQVGEVVLELPRP